MEEWLPDSRADALGRLRQLLRDLLELDSIDVDYGIHRLLRARAAYLNDFLESDLEAIVDEQLKSLTDELAADRHKRVEDLAARIRQTVGDDALLAGGEPVAEHPGFKGKQAAELLADYEAERREARASEVSSSERNELFNRAHDFLSRYYDNGGDFVPRRRYGSTPSYAIPSNGEEVQLYWATRGQHYAKSSDAFRDYRFAGVAKGKPFTVTFSVDTSELDATTAESETDDRVFVPSVDNVQWDPVARGLRAPFRFEAKSKSAGASDGPKSQDALSEEAVVALLKKIPDSAVRAELATPISASTSPLLRHLKRFTRRNTRDYFIHTDLKGFLLRELDFYLKDQVVNVLDADAASTTRGAFIRALQALVSEIVEVLAQFEDAQVRLFEKLKFVVGSDYLVQLRKVPPELLLPVLSNRAQTDRWRDVLAFNESLEAGGASQSAAASFARKHPGLVVNTSLFDTDFKDRLLGSFDDLAEATGGVAIRAENYQALRLLSPLLEHKVACVYIDPPYNTGKDEFLYKDRYQHATWLTMMEERLALASNLLHDEGLLFCSIDENESGRLRQLGEQVFGPQGFITELVWNTQHSQQAGLFTTYHEYVQVFGTKPSEQYANFVGGEGVIEAGALKKISKANPASDFDFPAGVRWDAPDGTTLTGRWGDVEVVELVKGKMVCRSGKTAYPVTLRAGWTQRSQMQKYFAGEPDVRDTKDQRVTGFFFTESGKVKILKERSRTTPTTILPEFGTVSRATEQLTEMFGKPVFGRPKPLGLIEYLVKLPTAAEHSIVLDFFAGSGTTGHAVMRLNRDDGASRRFILVEAGPHFDTVLVQRLEKAMYADAWSGGKPITLVGGEELERNPPLIKVMTLESFEDTLWSLGSEETLTNASDRSRATERLVGARAFRRGYLAELPLEASATSLSSRRLSSPFTYPVEQRPGGDRSTVEVDLIETFNYGAGLDVVTRQVWRDAPTHRPYVAITARDSRQRRVLVIWRDATDLDAQEERSYLQKRILDEGIFDSVLINGDSVVDGVASLDPVFHEIMSGRQ